MPVCTMKTRTWDIIAKHIPVSLSFNLTVLAFITFWFWLTYSDFGVRLVCPSYVYVNFVAWLASFCVSSRSAKVLAL